jgi:hypothetical protein
MLRKVSGPNINDLSCKRGELHNEEMCEVLNLDRSADQGDYDELGMYCTWGKKKWTPNFSGKPPWKTRKTMEK